MSLREALRRARERLYKDAGLAWHGSHCPSSPYKVTVHCVCGETGVAHVDDKLDAQIEYQRTKIHASHDIGRHHKRTTT